MKNKIAILTRAIISLTLVFNFSFGATLNLDKGVYEEAPSCQVGFTYDASSGICEKNPTCTNGTLDGSGKNCFAPVVTEGNSLYTLNEEVIGTCSPDAFTYSYVEISAESVLSAKEKTYNYIDKTFNNVYTDKFLETTTSNKVTQSVYTDKVVQCSDQYDSGLNQCWTYDYKAKEDQVSTVTTNPTASGSGTFMIDQWWASTSVTGKGNYIEFRGDINGPDQVAIVNLGGGCTATGGGRFERDQWWSDSRVTASGNTIEFRGNINGPDEVATLTLSGCTATGSGEIGRDQWRSSSKVSASGNQMTVFSEINGPNPSVTITFHGVNQNVTTKVCPAGYSDYGNASQCRKKVYSSPTMVCPADYSDNGSNCVKNINACPAGYTDNGTTCEKSEMVCTEGYTDNGSNCVQSIGTCPSDYANNGANCVKITYECPADFNEVTGKEEPCEKIDTTCPFGYEEFSDVTKCRKKVYDDSCQINYTCTKDKINCPLGSAEASYYVDEEGIKQICTEADLISCKPGYSYNSTTEKCESIPLCDTGTYNLSTNRCESNVICKNGFTYDSSSNKCIKPFESKDLECNDLHNYTGDQIYLESEMLCIAKEAEDKLIVTGNRNGQYKQWNSTSTSKDRQFVMWFGPTDCRNGWKPWKNFYERHYYAGVPVSKCIQHIGPYYIEERRKACTVGFLKGDKCVYNVSCEPGYTLKDSKCVKEESDVEYDINLGLYKLDSTCENSNLINENGICYQESSCNQNGVLNESSDRCELDTFNKCAGNEICVSPKEPFCEMGYIYNGTTDKCEAPAYCETGYIQTETGCKRDYSYSEYQCPDGFEGPVDPGFDCLASCGANGCECNATTPPANNCKKPFDLGNQPVVVTKKRDMETHIVEGSILPKEYGKYKGFECGENCLFTIEKIVGKDNQLCFYKENGQEDCITVYGCGFEGTITNNVEPNDLFDLNVDNQYVLSLGEYKPDPEKTADNLSCDTGLTYNPTLKMCTSEDVTNFNEGWTQEGILSQGNWQIKGSGTELLQTVNAPKITLFLHPQEFGSEMILEGKIKGNVAHYNSIGLAFGHKGNNDFYILNWSNSWITPSDLNLQKVTSTTYSNGYLPDNTEYIAGSTENIDWVAGNWYNIKAVVSGNNIKVFIDNKLYLEHTLQVGEFQGGRAGFFNLSTPNVSYKDFFLRGAPTCPEDFEWNSSTRTCFKEVEPQQDSRIVSTCKMNGHVGWHSRTEGIISVIPDAEKPDRILFWDSYQDRELGFLEFVKDVSAEDRADGFLPENNFPYEMLAKGFTAIEEIDDNTIYVSSRVMSDAECTTAATDNGLFKASVTSGANRDKIKRLSGDRFEVQFVDPSCPGGFYSPSTLSCLADIEDSVCVNGKYDNIPFTTGPAILQQYGGTWDNAQGDNIEISTAFYAPYTGLYNVHVATAGDTQVMVDGSLATYIQFFNQAETTQGYFMEEGLHEIKVIGATDSLTVGSAGGAVAHYGERGFAVVIYDEEYKVLSSSDKWCKNTAETECPTDGFVKIGNMCLETVLPHCAYGDFDEPIGQCVLLPKCILSKPGGELFHNQENSIKEETRLAENMAFKCSPLTCSNNSCQTADCPVDSEGNEYDGMIIGPGEVVDPEDCLQQSCDANKKYYEYCGKQTGCDTTNPLVYEDEDGNCKELYCEEGYIMDSSTKRCKKLECPSGTTEQPNGSCVRN